MKKIISYSFCALVFIYGAFILIRSYYNKQYIKGVKAGIDKDPVFTFVFDISKDMNRDMTIYEASLKKGNEIHYYDNQMKIGGTLMAVGVIGLLLSSMFPKTA